MHRRVTAENRDFVMDSVLADLKHQGFAYLKPLSADQVKEANEWLASRPVFADFHVPVHAKQRHLDPVTREYALSVCECFCVSNIL